MLGELCGDDHRELVGIACHIAPWQFAGTGGALVRRFKLDGDLAAGTWLVRAMANAWRQAAPLGFGRATFVPVPLHAARRRERGFDQAAWLARGLARRLGLRCEAEALWRLRPTVPQGDPRVLSRVRNVEGAFQVRPSARLAGRSCILVDDVFTSGATARECARVLRQSGVAEVAVLTACRS